MLEFRVLLDNKLVQKKVTSKASITIGRSEANDLVLHNKHVSRSHVVIKQEGDEFRLEDRSSNGVLVDGQRTSRSVLLSPRCLLGIYPFEVECLRLPDDSTLPLPKKDVKRVPLESSGESNPPPKGIPYHYGIFVGESASMQKRTPKAGRNGRWRLA